jgi:hypothetical protein
MSCCKIYGGQFQTDLNQATNKIITMYLQCLTGDWPRNWLQWLPWVEVEFRYNFWFQASLRTSSFQVVYGWESSWVHGYAPGETKLPAMHAQMMEQD